MAGEEPVACWKWQAGQGCGGPWDRLRGGRRTWTRRRRAGWAVVASERIVGRQQMAIDAGLLLRATSSACRLLLIALGHDFSLGITGACVCIPDNNTFFLASLHCLHPGWEFWWGRLEGMSSRREEYW